MAYYMEKDKLPDFIKWLYEQGFFVNEEIPPGSFIMLRFRYTNFKGIPMCHLFRNLRPRDQHLLSVSGDGGVQAVAAFLNKEDFKPEPIHLEPAYTGPKPVVECPICGYGAPRKQTQYGMRNECCGLHSWGVGGLVDQKTHDARGSAHESFDQIWKLQSNGISRPNAYKLLAGKMNMTANECHMKLMTEAQAKLVPGFTEEILKEFLNG